MVYPLGILLIQEMFRMCFGRWRLRYCAYVVSCKASERKKTLKQRTNGARTSVDILEYDEFVNIRCAYLNDDGTMGERVF